MRRSNTLIGPFVDLFLMDLTFTFANWVDRFSRGPIFRDPFSVDLLQGTFYCVLFFLDCFTLIEYDSYSSRLPWCRYPVIMADSSSDGSGAVVSNTGHDVQEAGGQQVDGQVTKKNTSVLIFFEFCECSFFAVAHEVSVGGGCRLVMQVSCISIMSDNCSYRFQGPWLLKFIAA